MKMFWREYCCKYKKKWEDFLFNCKKTAITPVSFPVFAERRFCGFFHEPFDTSTLRSA